MPAGSKMDLPLAKAEPISDSDIKVSEGEEVLQATEEIPIKTMAKQAVPLQPIEDDGEQRFHLQPVEDPTPEQVEAPEGGYDPMGSPHWSKLLAGPVDLWRKEPTLEQVCWQDL
ncbi:AN1-type zinc finger protein 5-like [Grus japonensis]|uniref:AN1-type zinc finger protein 5-like n=1 Tax=Grus japonensis TaxID=30415 RepID=A0ABC9YD21_GRUJA